MVLQWFMSGLVAVSAFVAGLFLGYVLYLAQPRLASPNALAPETLANRPSAPVAEATGTVAPQQTSLPPHLQGVPEVVDNVTLRLGGSRVHLYGLERMPGGRADDLSAYLRGRPVQCLKMAPADVYRCTVDAIDLSRAVLFNGGARADKDAPADLLAAEAHARSNRVGVWDSSRNPAPPAIR
jgi:endonuclease YncB( thermonuclease family)